MGSFPVDIDLRFDNASAQRALKDFASKAKAMMKDVADGVEGSGKRMEKALNDFASGVITNSTRAGRQVENQIRAVERWADAAGKTASQQTQDRYQKMIKSLEGNEKGIQRVTAAMQKWSAVEKDQVAKALDAEIKSLEKRAALMGQTPVDRMKAELAERVELLNGNTEAIKRATAAYQQMIGVEEREANVAREREIQGIQRRGAMAGQTPIGRLEAGRAEDMAKYNNDARVAASYDQQIAAARKETAEATEREVQALEKRGDLIGKSGAARLEIERAQAMEKYNNDARVALYYDKQIAAERQKETQAIEKDIQALERRAAIQGKTGEARLRAELAEEIKLYNGDAAAIARVTAAYEKMIVAEKASGHGGSTGNLIFRGIRDLFEGRTSYGTMDLGRAAIGIAGGGEGAAGSAGILAGIPATTLAVGGLSVALGASAVASYKAAEAMGDYAEQVHRTQIITGMSAEDVERFDYVAKATGTDVSMITRMMRPLAQALNESGGAAQKAREQLRAYGVDLYALGTGALKEKDLILQLGAALEANDNALLRDKGMIDILKKAGIEAGPMLVEMKDKFREASGLMVPSQAEIDKFKKIHDNLTLMKEELEEIKRASLEALAGLWVGLSNVLPNFPQLKPPPELKPEDMSKLGPQAFSGQQRLGLYGSLLEGGVGSDKFKGIAIGLTHEDYIKNLRQTDTEAAREWANQQKQIFDSYLNDTSTKTVQEVLKQKDAYMAAEAHAKALETADRNRLAINEALTRAGVLKQQREENPFLLPAQAELNRNLRLPGLTPQQAAQFRALYGPQITFEQGQQTDKLDRQRLEGQQAIQAELARTRLAGVTPVDVRELGQTGVTRANVERDIVAQYQQRVEIAKQTRDIEEGLINKRKIDARDIVGLAQQQRDLEAAAGKEQVADGVAAMEIKRQAYALAQRERDLAREHTEKMSEIQLSNQEDTIKHTADVARKTAELRFHGDSPAESIAEEYRIAVQESHDLFDAEMERIALHETGYKAEEAAQQAINKLRREDEAAAEDSAFKLAEMQQKQLDNLKSKIEPLYQTLFTNPKNFGKQLRGTVTEAALHPIVSGLSEMTATALHPFIYGASGTGGIAGALGGLFGHSAQGLGDIRPVNNSVPVWIMNLPTTSRLGPLPGLIDAGGGASTSIYSLGGYEGGGGTAFGGRQFRRFIQDASSGYGGAAGTGADFSTTVYAPQDVPTSYADGSTGGIGFGAIPGYRGGGFGGFGSGTVAGSRGGGGFGGGLPFSSLLKSLKGSFMPASYTGLAGEKIYTGAQSGFGANLGGVLSSQGAGALYMGAGIPLATAGIAGVRRGTAGGTVESMLGGAGVGAGIGTMIMPGLGTAIGAGVGAAAGLGIGLGEMLAGVESPRHEAIRLAQSLYRIHISNSAADQIVSIATQNYGGQVSVAIRSPQVRQMLGLYAAGTGQSNLFPQGMDTPHGASLVESGGRLQQQATYQYGQAFTQSSNLPVYGGMPTTTLGSPGGVNLALNIGGQDAARFLQGNVVSPDVVSTQYAAAMNSSNGRVSQALMMSEPGSIAS